MDQTPDSSFEIQATVFPDVAQWVYEVNLEGSDCPSGSTVPEADSAG